MTGRHHISRKVVYREKVFDQRTVRILSYNRSVLTKPKAHPVARCALGVVAAFVIAVATLGETPADEPVESAVAVTVAVPLPIVARPVEPVVMAPATETVAAPRVRHRPALRPAPAPAPVEEPVKNKHKKKDKDK